MERRAQWLLLAIREGWKVTTLDEPVPEELTENRSETEKNPESVFQMLLQERRHQLDSTLGGDVG